MKQQIPTFHQSLPQLCGKPGSMQLESKLITLLNRVAAKGAGDLAACPERKAAQ